MAGALLFSCAQPHYFLPPRLTLVHNYAELIALAFEQGEFYERKQIELRIMPSPAQQKSHLATFRQRVSNVMIESARSGPYRDIIQAEQFVWQQIEEELIRKGMEEDGE